MKASKWRATAFHAFFIAFAAHSTGDLTVPPDRAA
jgi:hypothetical protein